ncbi:hypothetical protein CYLTODRAFT_414434 [Cylindrobasidium torrendii FP15055 ss-10]|uniref:Uncharacterized protein n=1 Tax=Cylindrobasidium torrendii FP15055 ss-10 TaxID=1314674 RepID=A0A0D7AXC9_9AGAR|nr:hypothetical protein CYLTODRAFT_414434 [Cylindrobasidium torrendii FP15055 ss-10]
MSFAETTVSNGIEAPTIIKLNPLQDRTHINSFPFEVLAIVFKFYVFHLGPPHEAMWYFPRFQIGGGLPPQFVLKSVCKKWDKDCMELPELWASLSIAPRPAIVIPSGSPLWNQFAVVCKRALERSDPLPVQLSIESWHLNDDSQLRTFAGMGLDEDVFDNDSLANRIMRLATEHSLRWRTFVLRGIEGSWLSGVPWSQLAQVAHRVPLLQTVFLIDLRWREPPTLHPRCSDIFMDAPSLSKVYLLGCQKLPLNFPWSEPRTNDICIDMSWFESFSQYADFFFHIMRQTRAPAVQWVRFEKAFESSRHQVMHYPMIENPHVKKLRILGLFFPRMRLPNLTTLEFRVSNLLTDDNPFGVSQIESLLADSECRLQDLRIFDLAVGSEMYSIVSLLPYLDTLQALHYSGQSTLIMSDHTMSHAVDTLCEILASPTHLPNLAMLTLTIRHDWSPEEPRTPVHCYSPNTQFVNAVWEIVQARMLGQRPGIQLKKFWIQLEFYGADAVKLVDQESEWSSALRRIETTSVDFKFFEVRQGVNFSACYRARCVAARMLGQWFEVQLEKFQIHLKFPGVEVVKLRDQEFMESLAAHRVAETGVDFRIEATPRFTEISESNTEDETEGDTTEDEFEDEEEHEEEFEEEYGEEYKEELEEEY